MNAPEFHRPERIDTIGEGERTVTISANEAECAALAIRFGLIAIRSLDGAFSLKRQAGAILAKGRVTAQVVQTCVATGDPVPAQIDETVDLRFVGQIESIGDEVEIDADDCDVIVHDGSAIDLGEAAAETMALALDPFPRRADADAVLRAAGVISEEEAKPLGALASLKDRLEGKI